MTPALLLALALAATPPSTTAYFGPADPSARAVLPTPQHQAVRIRSAGWTGAVYRVEVGIPTSGPEALQLALWCPWRSGSLAGLVGTSTRQIAALGVVSLATDRPGNAADGVCTASINWRAGGVHEQRLGRRWEAPMPAPSRIAKVSSAAAAAAPASALHSLPFMARCDSVSGCIPGAPATIGLQVCYLGDQALPMGWDETRCPGDTRPSVTAWDWCQALRTIGTGFGVPWDKAEAIRRQTCPAQ